MHGSVLIVDDDESMCQMLEMDLRHRGFETQWCLSADDALALLENNIFDVMLTDLKLHGTSGIELCRRMAETRPDMPTIVITAFGSMETAIEAMRAGAYDFVTKPIDTDFLALALQRAIRHHDLQEKVRLLSIRSRQLKAFDDLLGESDEMKVLYSEIDRVADIDAAILITGETGSGKELVARALHNRGHRKSGPFITVNCAALPANLIESELFGHVKGAFTDAKTPHKGLFLQADGGTLFLDEVGDFPLDLQGKLLRVLEEGSVRPVGADRQTAFDARIITATHRDLETAVRQERFREDLYFRLNVIQLGLPPLRDRGTDILLLAQHFVEHFALRFNKRVTGISRSAAEKLLSYPWPGNVRELKHCMERAVALTRFDKIAIEDLTPRVAGSRKADILIPDDFFGDLPPLSKLEQRYILHVLKATGNNRTKAARILGLDRKTLYRKLQEYLPADSQ
jgi:two-component system response regulator HydG